MSAPTMKNKVAGPLREVAARHGMWEVWRDWCAITAISLRNTVDRFNDWEAREAEYKRITGGYTTADMECFGEALAGLIAELENDPRDVLGETYMALEISSKELGQFFTPWTLCKVLAQNTLENLEEKLTDKPFIRINDPACGACGLLIAAAEVMKDKGFNPQTQAYWVAQDLSIVAVHESYIQLTLLGLPGVVVHQDTLTNETFDTWFTPAHILGGWNRKLRRELGHPVEPLNLGQGNEPQVVEADEAIDWNPADYMDVLPGLEGVA